MKKSKGNLKDRAQIASAALGTLSTTMDIVSPMVSGGLENSVGGVSIKIVGSSAGMVASALNFSIDVSDLIGEISGKQRWINIGLNTTKAVSDFSIMLKALGGLVETLTKKGLVRTSINRGVTKIVAWRFFTYMASWEVMFLIFAIEQYIAIFTDNDLQKWCRSSVFGSEPDSNLKSTFMIISQSERNSIYEDQSARLEESIGVVL